MLNKAVEASGIAEFIIFAPSNAHSSTFVYVFKLLQRPFVLTQQLLHISEVYSAVKTAARQELVIVAPLQGSYFGSVEHQSIH